MRMATCEQVHQLVVRQAHQIILGQATEDVDGTPLHTVSGNLGTLDWVARLLAPNPKLNYFYSNPDLIFLIMYNMNPSIPGTLNLI